MKTILITGASKGIGRALATECAKRKFNVALIARTHELLQAQSEGLRAKFDVEAPFLAIDLSQEESPERLLLWCHENQLQVCGLINNAGFNVWGAFREKPISDFVEMLDLNLYAVLRLTHALIPELAKQPQSYIMNVASTGAFQPTPWLSVYGAGKAFILFFSKALRFELKEDGIAVSCLCPGPTESEMYKRTGSSALKDRAKRVEMRAEKVARIGIAGMLAGKAVIVPGFSNKLGVFLNRILPGSIGIRVISRLLRP